MSRICPKCGMNISDVNRFCTSCGTDLNSYDTIIGNNKNEQSPQFKINEKIPSNISEESRIVSNENKTQMKIYSNKNHLGKIKISYIILGIVFVVVLIGLCVVWSVFLARTSGNVQSSVYGSNVSQLQSSPLNLPLPIPTESQTNRNIRIVKEILVEYHNTHTYSLSDMFVCGDMAMDVWNMVETKGINAKLNVGNVDKDITKITDANHVWVLAEISPNQWLALETTGGYVVCSDSSICPIDNSRYFHGWSFNTPRELKDALDTLKHPCSDGYVFGSDQKCHESCGGNTYCTGNSVCVNGQCKGCDAGYILGDDLKCHQPCGSTTTYCTGNSVCVNGQCKGCDTGYILGDDLKCHQPCGSTTTYCTGNSVCVNGQCRGCSPGYYLGTDLRCHKS